MIFEKSYSSTLYINYILLQKIIVIVIVILGTNLFIGICD